jgi:hypothetical protein
VQRKRTRRAVASATAALVLGLTLAAWPATAAGGAGTDGWGHCCGR